MILPYVERTDEWREAIHKGKSKSPNFASLPLTTFGKDLSLRKLLQSQGKECMTMEPCGYDQEEHYGAPSHGHSRERTK